MGFPLGAADGVAEANGAKEEFGAGVPSGGGDGGGVAATARDGWPGPPTKIAAESARPAPPAEKKEDAFTASLLLEERERLL